MELSSPELRLLSFIAPRSHSWDANGATAIRNHGLKEEVVAEDLKPAIVKLENKGLINKLALTENGIAAVAELAYSGKHTGLFGFAQACSAKLLEAAKATEQADEADVTTPG